jgi:ribosome-binding ATPase
MTSVGFVGLPGGGKSTVFHALTRQAVAPQFLGYDLKPHQAVVKIPDPRLDWLAVHYKARSVVNATMEFVDIPGFDPASTEQKLMTAVLEHYRRCDALVLVVDLFSHDAAQKAAKGMRALLDELALLDLVAVERAAGNVEKAVRLKGDPESRARFDLLGRAKAQLEEAIPLRRMELPEDDLKHLRDLGLFSGKQLIVLLNVSEDDFAKPDADVPGLLETQAVADAEGLLTLRFAAALESALAEMTDDEAKEYMAEFGVTEPALPRFIRAASSCLGLITYLTGSEKEVRTWALKRGSNAQQAAGVIHSDLARGFIRAETVAFSDLVQCGSFVAAKSAGKVRLEGKDYIVADGDVLHIRFNV